MRLSFPDNVVIEVQICYWDTNQIVYFWFKKYILLFEPVQTQDQVGAKLVNFNFFGCLHVFLALGAVPAVLGWQLLRKFKLFKAVVDWKNLRFIYLVIAKKSFSYLLFLLLHHVPLHKAYF